MGSAHQIRLVAFTPIGGGGGGKDTLGSAVMPTLLFVASMTVTEVTTRIVVVGVVTLAGLFVMSRRSISMRPISVGSRGQPSFSGKRQHFVTNTPEHQIPNAQGGLAQLLFRRPVGFVARITSLGIIAVAAGLALGVGLSLALVTVLNALGSGAS